MGGGSRKRKFKGHGAAQPREAPPQRLLPPQQPHASAASSSDSWAPGATPGLSIKLVSLGRRLMSRLPLPAHGLPRADEMIDVTTLHARLCALKGLGGFC